MEDLIEALQILLKYGNPRCPTHCEHDVLYICDIDHSDVGDEDMVKLNDLGFIVDKCNGGFMSFRFGSA